MSVKRVYDIKRMRGLTKNQKEIAIAIYNVVYDPPARFATVDEVADMAGVTDQTVLNNREAVLDAVDEIECRKVGQAFIFTIRGFV